MLFMDNFFLKKEKSEEGPIYRFGFSYDLKLGGLKT